MRLELLDERSRSFVLAFLEDLPHRNQRKPIGPPQAEKKPSQSPEAILKNDALHTLAEELINNLCGSHSLGLIYRFLLGTYGTPAKARAEFERYLSGHWSSEWIDAARSEIEKAR